MTEITPRQHEKYERLIAAAKALPPLATAVAHPCDETSLKGALEAAEAGLIKPILVGPKDKIISVARAFSLDLSGIEIIDVPHSQAAAETAVALVRSGKAELLMKGSLHTDELLSEVVKRDTGIRTGRRISHVFVMDVPGHPHTLFITDAAVNIAPDLTAKHDIIQSAIDLHVGLGLGTPKVAILSAVETVTPLVDERKHELLLSFTSTDQGFEGGLMARMPPGRSATIASHSMDYAETRLLNPTSIPTCGPDREA